VTKECALIILRDATDAREWVVDRDLTVGRDPECDIYLPDRQVSRRHATVRRTATGYTVADEGSKNGTWLNGARVAAPVGLSDGDVVSIAARFKLCFVDAEATAPLVFEGRGLRLSPATVTVFVNGEALDPALSGAQWELVRALYEAHGTPVSRDELIQRVWPDADAGGVSEDSLDALVRRVRMRLSEIDPDQQFIVTLRGYGYRLDRS
jgi:DNA-binding response OmpR family regulator